MNVEIAQRLAIRRRQAGLSQETLAEKLGVSRQAVSKWERSESSPDTDNLIALAQLYGVSLDDLLYVDDQMRDDVVFEAADRAASRVTAEEDGIVGSSTGTAAQADGGANPWAGAQTPFGTATSTASQENAQPESGTSSPENANVPGSSQDYTATSGDDSADSDAGAKVKIGIDGIHVLDGDDYVHVSWRDGVHVHDSKKGDEVHVSWDGVHVKEGHAQEQGAQSPQSAQSTATEDAQNATEQAGKNQDSSDKKNKDWFVATNDGFAAADDEGNEVHVDGSSVFINGEHFNSWREAHEHYGHSSKGAWTKFPFPLLVILVYVLVGIFNGAWGVGLFLFFTIPLYYMIGNAIHHKRIAPLVAGAYPLCAVAWFFYMAFVVNMWHPAWIVFLTIPLVEWLVCALSRWWRTRKRSKIDAKNAPIDVEAQ